MKQQLINLTIKRDTKLYVETYEIFMKCKNFQHIYKKKQVSKKFNLKKSKFKQLTL